MAKATKEELTALGKLVDEAAEGLAEVSARKMFGCHALFARDNVFALVWKEGRIGVRLPEPAPFESLMGQAGSAPWKAGAMTMSHWVLVPPQLHEETVELKRWIATAHGIALAAPPKAKGSAKKTAAKKAAAGKSAKPPARKASKRAAVTSR